jgi:hypothetical protein
MKRRPETCMGTSRAILGPGIVPLVFATLAALALYPAAVPARARRAQSLIGRRGRVARHSRLPAMLAALVLRTL